ncbi:MAG: hypothetical protein CMF36_13595 [Leeuwenhoekiella sp.]|nr:hypothetical protein [Leeuwenhoekiella sp.]MAW95511.1 hypothetical protein [Leeuwenhoekiella sp.]MBA82159.1 hypothetical protein [Leeuwenhoekiella sp.]|tara:strand:- start:12983 stop:13165 length:183 start_codon:yes stop_codon:yes gene_type:complete
MTRKFSLNLFLVILLYSCILISGLLNILTRVEVLAGLAVIFGLLLFNLIKNQSKDTASRR